MIIYKTTIRGFAYVEFKDRYNQSCSIQKSSLATEDAIWFGINDANPQVLGDYGQGWIPYSIPDEVYLATRMHLTQEQVGRLLPILKNFVDTGEIGQMKTYLKYERKKDNVTLVFHENGVLIGEISPCEDGYLYFWPNNDRTGYWPSYILLELGNKLEELNQEWDKKVSDDLEKIRK